MHTNFNDLPGFVSSDPARTWLQPSKRRVKKTDQIVAAIAEDPRRTRSEIARAVGCSQQLVHFAIKSRGLCVSTTKAPTKKTDQIVAAIATQPLRTQSEIARALGCSRQLVHSIIKTRGLCVPKRDPKPKTSVKKFSLVVKMWLRRAGYRYCPRCFCVFDRVSNRGYCQHCNKALARQRLARLRQSKMDNSTRSAAGCSSGHDNLQRSNADWSR
jgi:hypothetical protein